MDINASVDVGNNIKELIEKFANSIGTTAKDLFPYYVKQVYLIAMAHAILLVSATLFSVIIAFKTLPKADFNNGNAHTWGFIASAGCSILCAFIWIAHAPSTFAALVNPEYGAIHKLIADVSQLMPGK